MHKIPLWAYLALALAISLGLNIFQAKDRWIQEAVAPIQQELDTLKVTDKAEDDIAALKKEHDTELQKVKDGNKNRSGKREVVYRDRVLTLPAAGCAPGADRVDSWNALGLGAKE
jgi:hypothetical protein